MEERLLNVEEAAEMLGIKPATLYQWVYQRRLPIVKLFGHALRFKLSVIQEIIRESERPALDVLPDGYSGPRRTIHR